MKPILVDCAPTGNQLDGITIDLSSPTATIAVGNSNQSMVGHQREEQAQVIVADQPGYSSVNSYEISWNMVVLHMHGWHGKNWPPQ